MHAVVPKAGQINDQQAWPYASSDQLRRNTRCPVDPGYYENGLVLYPLAAMIQTENWERIIAKVCLTLRNQDVGTCGISLEAGMRDTWVGLRGINGLAANKLGRNILKHELPTCILKTPNK